MSFFEELKRRNVFRVGIAYGVAAWVLLQVVDLVLDNIEAPDWVMDVFMLVVVLGFIVSLVIAWAYELTPEGIKREAEVSKDDSVTHHTAKKLDKITLAAIAILLVFIVVDRFVLEKPASVPIIKASPEPTAKVVPAPVEPGLEPRAETDRKSIAVLPLANRSVNPEDAFFAEGMHDEILTRLSRIGSLKVISRTSVMGYTGTTKKMAEIGQELGVATLLEGGVQRAGNRVRVNVQLIEAATDKHLWAEIFDRELTTDNLFDIQSEITRSISDALQAVLTGEEQIALDNKPTENVEAYAYYLRAKALAAGYGRSTDLIKQSISTYQSALTLDPKFAAAWAALATDWTELHWQSSGVAGEREEAEKALARARELAPGSAETLIAEGYLHYWGYLDYEKALTAFEAALRKKPGSVLALRGTAYVLRRMGRFEECISTFRRAIELDPNDPGMPADLGYTLLRKGQMNEAGVFFRRAITQDPANLWNRWSYSYHFAMLNDLSGALEIMGSETEDLSEYQVFQQYSIARYTNDDAVMQKVFAAWKGREEITGAADLAYGVTLFTKGQLDGYQDTLISLEQTLLDAATKSTRPETPLGQLIMLYGMLGDREKLELAIQRFKTELKPDELRIVEVNSEPYAWTMIGEKDKALDYAEELVNKFGIWEFYFFVLDPVFDSLRGEPRYKMLALEYDRWLETVQP